MVTIHSSERAAVEARGGTVGDDGMLVTENGCTFKNGQTNLCDLHTTPDKPFGCIASPFTLNSNGTLIVRNRYRMLPCYIPKSDPAWRTWPPAFEAFRASFDLIFDVDEAARIVEALVAGGDPHEAHTPPPPTMIEAAMPRRSYDILLDNDRAKKEAR